MSCLYLTGIKKNFLRGMCKSFFTSLILYLCREYFLYIDMKSTDPCYLIHFEPFSHEQCPLNCRFSSENKATREDKPWCLALLPWGADLDTGETQINIKSIAHLSLNIIPYVSQLCPDVWKLSEIQNNLLSLANMNWPV